MKNLSVLVLVLAMTGTVMATPPNNDTCADALWLIDQGFTAFDVDLCQFENDYDLANAATCVDRPLPGPDAVWRATLLPSEFVSLTATTDAEVDVVMYLVSDCGDVGASCVASSTDSGGNQVLEYDVDASGVYYLVIDSAAGCGQVHVEMGGVLATEAVSWSSVKSLYN